MNTVKSRFPVACASLTHCILVMLAAGCPLVFLGCDTSPHYWRYRVAYEAVPVDALETYKKDKAEVPARIQVVNFVVQSVSAHYSPADKEVFRRHNAINIPNILQRSLGERQVFSEVARTEVADPALADYIVSGTYDFSEGTVQDTYADWHSITVLGILHIRVVRAKDNVVVLDKDFTEERTDGARRNVTVHVNYLQSAFIEPITAEIKRMVAADLSAFKSTAPVKTPAVSP